MERIIEIENVDVSTLSLHTYSFTKRVTENELLRAYSRKIKAAQNDYKSKLNDAANFLTANLRKCQEMDFILGVSSDVEDGSFDNEDVPEGKQRCPVNDCKASTFKLKRHLKTHDLTENQIEYAMNVAQLFTKNSQPTQTGPTRSKAGKPSNTNLVNRKCNYKECPICKRLILNITDHLKNTHKINNNDSKYTDYIKHCRVVPRIYTKKKRGVTTLLANKSLDDAREEYEEEVNRQKKTLDKLKELRKEIEDLTQRLREKPSNKDEKKLQDLTALYNKEKNKESKSYPPKIEHWMTTFEEYLIARGDSNPKRGTKMATEVFFPDSCTEEISFLNLLDARYVRFLLQEFKQKTTTNSTTKIKYIKYFELFIKFITRDLSSPEYRENLSNEELITQDIKIKGINHEIETMISQLSKNRGKDLIIGKQRAKNKLISSSDSYSMLKENEAYLREISEKSKESLNAMNMQQIRKVRDSLIVAATIRIPRRSKELITLSLEEYANAEDRVNDGENFKIIKVLDQKNAKAGEAAPVVFSACEYAALTTYVKHLRPRFGNNIDINNVFVSCVNQFSVPTSLTFSSIYKIMQKFSTSSGKKLSSRALRGSKVTDSRNKNYSLEQKQQLATAMSHSLQTADRNYNYSEVSDSVAKVIALDKSLHDHPDSVMPSTSTPVKQRPKKRKITCKDNTRKGMLR